MDNVGGDMGVLEERHARIEKIVKDLRNLYPKYENLLRIAAVLMDDCQRHDKEAKKWEEEWLSNEVLRDLCDLPTTLKSQGKSYNPDELKKLILGMDCMALTTHAALAKALSSVSALKAANAGHSQKGGSRDKQEKIRQLWATGKYKSKTKCARDECDKIGMSYDTARRALINYNP